MIDFINKILYKLSDETNKNLLNEASHILFRKADHIMGEMQIDHIMGEMQIDHIVGEMEA